MYSFTSTSDFDNKTGYVTQVTYCNDWNGYGKFYPLETMYEFDNLFSRFQSEISAAISGGTTFDTGPLLICKAKYVSDSSISSNYLAARVSVSTTAITVYIGVAASHSDYSGLTSGTTITFSDFLNGTHLYNTGRIYIVQYVQPDTANGGLSGNWNCTAYLGDASGYIGVYQEPTYTYPSGQMVYTFSAYTIPSLVATGTTSQTGYPETPATLQAQPELVAKCSKESIFAIDNAYFCDANGDYDPSPTPPGPTPPGPPTPGTDPNQDPNVEPGDNPNPSPGPHNRDYDPIPVPPAPTVTSLGAGMCSLYVPTSAILNLLADEIFSDNIIQIIENIFNNPQDMIAGLSIVPFVVPVSGQYYHKVGRYTSSIAMQRAASQFVDIDCGSVLVEHYHNNFLDADPFTKLKIWLPYIGYQDLSVDDVMGCIVSVKYRCDILSGACVAFISTGLEGGVGAGAQRVIAQYSGNCAVQVPTAAQSYDNMVSTAVNILTTAGATAVGGGGALGVAAGLASSAANYVTTMKPDVKRNGTPGSTAGYMAVQKPYILRFTPRVSVPDDFIDLKGYASNRSGNLGSFYGYAEVESIKLENVYGTDSEIAEILSLLKEGVFI